MDWPGLGKGSLEKSKQIVKPKPDKPFFFEITVSSVWFEVGTQKTCNVVPRLNSQLSILAFPKGAWANVIGYH